MLFSTLFFFFPSGSKFCISISLLLHQSELMTAVFFFTLSNTVPYFEKYEMKIEIKTVSFNRFFWFFFSLQACDKTLIFT